MLTPPADLGDGDRDKRAEIMPFPTLKQLPLETLPKCLGLTFRNLNFGA